MISLPHIPPSLYLYASGAAITLGAAFWQRTKLLISDIFGMAIIQCQIDENSYDLSQAFTLLLHTRFTRRPGSRRIYEAMNYWVKPLDANRTVPFESPVKTGSTLFWKGWRPIYVTQTDTESKGGNKETKYKFFFLKGMFDADKLINEATDIYDERLHGQSDIVSRYMVKRFSGRSKKDKLGNQAQPWDDPAHANRNEHILNIGAIRYVKWTREQLGRKSVNSPLDRLALPDKVNEVVKEIKQWLHSKKWYNERGIPWKKGYLFHGSPGNGKTATIRALAEDLGVPVCVFDLASMDNGELFELWQEIKGFTPCLVVFEDFDAVFVGRESTQEDGVTFDAVLNCIDGVDQTDGIILIITTNHPETLDPAIGAVSEGGGMSTRPGRIDAEVKLTPPNAAGRLKIATRIMEGLLISDNNLAILVEDGVNDSGAQFQERCSKLALQIYWSNQGDKHA